MAEMQRSDWLTSMKSTHRRFGPSSLSCKDVVVNGEDRKIMIINSDDFDLKYAHCIFDDFLIVGSYIEWNDETWMSLRRAGKRMSTLPMSFKSATMSLSGLRMAKPSPKKRMLPT